MNNKNIRGRFAPSPSGRMHLGNIYSALLSYLSAKSRNGEWIIRIEDLDRQRCKREYAEVLLDDLRWMGLESDDKIIYQSERDKIYEEALEKLVAKGLTYGCYCSRADIMAARAPHESDGHVVYSGRCRNLSNEERKKMDASRKPATRIITEDKEVSYVDGHYGEQRCNLSKDCGDFILRRADGNFAYQLAVVVDDAQQGINEVVRGRDLMGSTHQQIYLYRELGFEVPEFYHLPLLMSSEGHRLAKRDKCTDMGYLRERYSREELTGRILYLAGITEYEEAISIDEAISAFDWSKMNGERGIVAC